MQKIISRRRNIITLLMVFFVLLLPLLTMGTSEGVLIESEEDVYAVLGNIAIFITNVFTIVTVIFFLLAAFHYFTASSAGDTSKVGKANRMVVYGIIGLVVATMAWGMSTLVENFLDVEKLQEAQSLLFSFIFF